LKYWLLTTEYPPFFGGGIGTYCAITATMMAGKGHDVTVFVSDPGVRDFDVQEAKGIRVIRFGTSRTNSSSFLGHTTNLSFEFAAIVRHFVQKEGAPDMIESQEYLGIAYYLLQYKHLLYDWCKDIPVLITMHSPSWLNMKYNHVPVYRYPNFWICEMERFCLRAASFIISPSAYLPKEISDEFELDSNKIAIVPNPFDAGFYGFDNISASDTSGDEIVFYGKLTVQKGAFKLLKYFQQLWDNGFEQPLYLLGGQDIVYHPEGMTMGDIIRRKYKDYIDRGLLKLEDRIPPAEIGARLSRAAVVIIPSENDNLPYVVLEMMALGKIVLASRQGGHSEIIEDGEDGFLFDHYVPASFSQQLLHILDLNEEERQKITASAKKKVGTKYNTEVIYASKIKLLEKLISDTKSPARVFPFVRSKILHKPGWDNRSLIRGKLSIVIPYYNMGEFIEETVQSLRNAYCADKEIIIINDGSTDASSIHKLEDYDNDPLVKVIHEPNRGLATARNIGASHASGEFLAFLDADDTIEPQYYQRAINVFNQYDNVHFAGCWVRYFAASRGVWPTFMPEAPLILNHNMVNSSSLVYKRNAFLAAGQNDPGMAFQGMEDYESVVSLVANGFGGVVIPEIWFNYRIRHNSMFRAISKAKKLNLYEFISNKHKEFYATFAGDIFNLLNANGPGILLDNPTLDYHLADGLPFGRKLSGKMIRIIKSNPYLKSVAYTIYKQLKK
jgi:glycosyltransferase involved in cell wall biosynthesis